MNWEQIEGRWNEMKGQIRQKWGKMTDSDFERIAGKKDELLGWLQKQYGYSKQEAEQEMESFRTHHGEFKESTGRKNKKEASH